MVEKKVDKEKALISMLEDLHQEKIKAEKQRETIRKALINMLEDIKQQKDKIEIAYNQLKDTTAQLIQQSKLSSIGELAAGLAHEIGNPLQAILGNVELLLTEIKSDELNAIKEAALRAREITKNLLDFSRQTEMKFVLEDVNEVLDKTLSLYSAQLEFKKIKIEKHYQDNLPQINMSVSHIEQVFLNIISNAQKAMPNGGTLTISTKLEVRSENTKEECIQISFRDTGVGISKENLPRIFEPFFTTHKEGTGLGLSVSYGIVKQHGGEILVFSDGKGKGAEFVVRLPKLQRGTTR